MESRVAAGRARRRTSFPIATASGRVSQINDKRLNGFEAETLSASPYWPNAAVVGLRGCDCRTTEQFRLNDIAITNSGYVAIAIQPGVLASRSFCCNQRGSTSIRTMCRSGGEIWITRESGGGDSFYNYGVSYAATQTIVVFAQWPPSTELLVSVDGVEMSSTGRTEEPTQASGRWAYGQSRGYRRCRGVRWKSR